VQLFYCDSPTEENSLLNTSGIRRRHCVLSYGQVQHIPRYLRKEFRRVIAPHLTEDGTPVRKSALSDLKYLSYLKSRKDEVFEDALGKIKENKDTSKIPVLCELLDDDRDLRVQMIGYVLSEIGDDRAIEPLIKALKRGLSGNMHCCAVDSCAMALAEVAGRVGDKRALAPLVESLANPHSVNKADSYFKPLFDRFPKEATALLRRALAAPSRGNTGHISSVIKRLVPWKPSPSDGAEYFEYSLNDIGDEGFTRTRKFDDWFQKEIDTAASDERRQWLKRAQKWLEQGRW